ncbi:hypothetical protein E8E12_001281 [Didymella heteroderae]|uniref:Uncharacterized protein n=1 Tax=Didymella heteroderae TaxID=1769908 RepID=A0A9P5BZL3_9PLEO|nr:hypothetical protein E8E12_001281 [Didymella heteroderae]
MIDEPAERIVRHQLDGAEQYCALALNANSQADLRNHFIWYHIRNDMLQLTWSYKKEREAGEAARAHDVEATAKVAVDIVDELLDVYVLEAPRGTGSGTTTTPMGSDGTVEGQSPALERAESLVEVALNGFRFDGHDKVLRARHHASTPSIRVAMEEEKVSNDEE